MLGEDRQRATCQPFGEWLSGHHSLVRGLRSERNRTLAVGSILALTARRPRPFTLCIPGTPATARALSTTPTVPSHGR